MRFIERHLNVCSNFGGLGDHIARLCAIRYIKEEHPHVRFTVYWHNYFVPIARTLVPESDMLRHKSLGEFQWADDKLPLIDFTPDYVTSLSLGLIEHAFIVLTQRLPRPQDRTYPKYQSTWSRGIDLPNFDNYVVLTPCFTAPVREWKGEEINKTLKGLSEMGFKTVLLGNTTAIPTGNGNKIKGGIPKGLDLSLASLNLIDQTTLIEALEIMSHAKLVMGVDNGLLHLSACTNTPSVWGFTSVEQELRLPGGIRSESVLPELRYGCQSRPYLVDHDFKFCMYEECLCIAGMKAEKFLHKAKILLDLP